MEIGVKSKLIIADDSRTIQRVVELVLESEGFDVIKVEEVVQLTSALEQNDISLVLIDIDFPNAELKTLVRQIKNRHPDISLVMLVANYDEIDSKAAKKLGFDAILMKPFDSQALIEVVSEFAKINAKWNMDDFDSPSVLSENLVDKDIADENFIEEEAHSFEEETLHAKTEEADEFIINNDGFEIQTYEESELQEENKEEAYASRHEEVEEEENALNEEFGDLGLKNIDLQDDSILDDSEVSDLYTEFNLEESEDGAISFNNPGVEIPAVDEITETNEKASRSLIDDSAIQLVESSNPIIEDFPKEAEDSNLWASKENSSISQTMHSQAQTSQANDYLWADNSEVNIPNIEEKIAEKIDQKLETKLEEKFAGRLQEFSRTTERENSDVDMGNVKQLTEFVVKELVDQEFKKEVLKVAKQVIKSEIEKILSDEG